MLLRSVMFVPAHNKKIIEKGINSNADAIIIDLEDSVSESDKVIARKTAAEYIAKGIKRKMVFIRTNSLESPMLLEDINACANKYITGFMPPKISSEDDMLYLDKLLNQKEKELNLKKGYFKLVPLVETAAAVLNLASIVRHSDRTIAICFGGEDYLNDICGTHGHPPKAFVTPKALIAMAARSVGIIPIDTPFLDLHDREGFIKEKQEAFEMGFGGSLLINPRQIEDANRCFTPSQKEVERSKEIIQAIKKSNEEGIGCVMLGDVMIGPPMQRRAERIVRFMELVEKK